MLHYEAFGSGWAMEGGRWKVGVAAAASLLTRVVVRLVLLKLAAPLETTVLMLLGGKCTELRQVGRGLG